jgi:hypothetical protein
MNQYTYIRGSRREEATSETHLGFRPLADDVVGLLRLRWTSGLEGVSDHSPLLV